MMQTELERLIAAPILLEHRNGPIGATEGGPEVGTPVHSVVALPYLPVTVRHITS